MKYKRKIKWDRIIILVIAIIIVTGGICMLITSLSNKNNKEQIKDNKEKDTITEEKDTITENTDVTIEKAPNNYLEFQLLEDGEYLTEKGYTLKIENKVASINGNIIVNKTYSVPENFKPNNPKVPIKEDKCIECLDKDVMNAFNLMLSDAKSIGLNIYIASGYRSYKYQERLYNNYTAVSGVVGADTYSARPGHSEHQTGVCFDLNTVNDSFANTNEGKWIDQNAAHYGFIIRYPKGKEHITGYQYESWHLRYVGEELAKELYQDGNWLTLEEYYGISSSYE